ncbi:NAD-dependent epimerase/dehydratase family protein [Rhodococcus sp. SGAir0479]|uniref:NAD-dependent epimerase/dehydratase family protein n=1 Tax=Rhodococcus sp. SGAir0479 TaxID=2567884 RepID=UPI0010CCD833|nr:NAD-dependent epimerase/dehydratase family protein [Rhodococcus sp. SGAir0479]QCQ93051.1 NAD-dependent epimerase/dehydratase family protein [Rhodococcus sp. SGAir0479]
MKIAVTGGTGYLGAHTTRALLGDGHDIRLLVHPDESAADALAVLDDGTGRVEVLRGDIRDAAVIAALLGGCDAVLHAAGVVGTDNRRETLMWEVNTAATASLLTRAAFLGLDPIVHVASYSALFPSPDPVIGPDSPTAPGRSAYGRTKAAADRIARALQDAGAPVVITYPSSVVGPGLGGMRGVTATGWAPMIAAGVAPRLRGGMQMIDVRDVADVHAAAMRPGRGPRRYMCGGELIAFDEIVDILETASGQRIRRIPLQPSLFRAMGRIADVLGAVTPVSAGFSYEAAWLLTAATPTDDACTLSDLGLAWRPARAAVAASVTAPGPDGAARVAR